MAAVSEAAQLLGPLVAPDRRIALSDAVARAQRGHSRVLVLGEAKRGKSSLVNALFEAVLLPTGALPLTSVASVVVVGDDPRCEARYRDGRTERIELDQVGALVSEHGNPSNQLGLDRVLLAAPCRLLPRGTEVVDTPGTGSIHTANSDEAERARSTLDLAILVVSADPPVSIAELDLLDAAMEVASRAAVVVNKADLLDERELAEVREFTARATADRLNRAVPVFALSALSQRRRDDGFEVFTTWLDEQLRSHGADDATTSTIKALRREASRLRDTTMVQCELTERGERQDTLIQTELAKVLDRADDHAQTMADHLRGEAARLRNHLDAAHESATASTVAEVANVINEEYMRSTELSPEQLAGQLHDAAAEMTRTRAHDWYQGMSEQLETGMRATLDKAHTSLQAELIAARATAGTLLNVELSPVEHLPAPTPPKPPSFDTSVHPGWQELLSQTVKRRLPAPLRRRRMMRDLRRRQAHEVGRPFGRARASLQQSLREMTDSGQRGIEILRAEYTDAVRAGLNAATDQASDPTRQRARADLTDRRRQLDTILTLLR